MRKVSDIAQVFPRGTLGAVAVILVIAAVFGAPVVSMLDPATGGDPRSASERATNVIERATGRSVDPAVIAIVSTPGGVDSVTGRARLNDVVRQAKSVADVAAVEYPPAIPTVPAMPSMPKMPVAPTLPPGAPPLSPEAIAQLDAARQQVRAAQAQVRAAQVKVRAARGKVRTLRKLRAPLIEKGGNAALLLVYVRPLGEARAATAVDRVIDRLEDEPGVQLAGTSVVDSEVQRIIGEDLRRSELVIIPLLILLALLFFRSVVAALIPVTIAGAATLITLLGLRVASEFTTISAFSVNLTSALATGLGIDYGLLLVTRFREELAAGADTPTAVSTTVRTAGRAVFYSSLTVAASMAGLLVFPQRYLTSMGFAGMLVALISGMTALIAVPALLTLLGPRVNSLSPRWLQRRASLSAEVLEEGWWFRLASWVSRHAVLVAIVTSVGLIALALPTRHVKFTSADVTVLPAGSPARAALDRLQKDFPREALSPVPVAFAGQRAVERARTFERDIATRAETRTRVTISRRARSVSRDAAVVELGVAGRALSESAQRDVRRIVRVSRAQRGLVGGETSRFLDHKDSVLHHTVTAVAIVVAATIFFMMLLTGSVVLPVKAVIMNALTLLATFGVLTWVFVDGHLQSLLGFTSQGALEVGQPALVCALVFGLSTDYGVFLLARVKESVDEGIDNTRALCIGIERTGRIITAAALLFCVAMGATSASRLVTVKQVGFGVGLAVLIDATIVRALLVPALMKLLGTRNWWAPGPLARLHRKLHE